MPQHVLQPEPAMLLQRFAVDGLILLFLRDVFSVAEKYDNITVATRIHAVFSIRRIIIAGF